MLENICVAGGSIPGADHAMPGKPGWINNHDAYAVRIDERTIVAVVCDGCGSGKHSEVGAKIASELFAENISTYARRLLDGNPATKFTQEKFWHRIEQQITSYLTVLSGAMGESVTQVVDNFFLFTLIGVLVTENEAYIFSIVDWVYAINGDVRILGPFPKNEPPYIMYALTGSSLTSDMLKIKVNYVVPTTSLESILIGSDGVSYFLDAEEYILPGGGVVGPLSQFWENDLYLKNPDAIRRRLAIINKEVVDEKRIKGGPLKDDTTLIVVKKFNKCS